MAIDADKVTATLKNGILQLTMPKAAKSKTIEIKPRAAVVFDGVAQAYRRSQVA